MDKIEIKVLNYAAVKEAEKHMVFAARLTQRGHMIHSMKELMELSAGTKVFWDYGGDCRSKQKISGTDYKTPKRS